MHSLTQEIDLDFYPGAKLSPLDQDMLYEEYLGRTFPCTSGLGMEGLVNILEQKVILDWCIFEISKISSIRVAPFETMLLLLFSIPGPGRLRQSCSLPRLWPKQWRLSQVLSVSPRCRCHGPRNTSRPAGWWDDHWDSAEF